MTRPWSTFFAKKNSVLNLDLVARRYGVRPSEIVGLPRGLGGLAFDIAVAWVATESEIEQKIADWWWLRIYDILGGKGGRDKNEVTWL